MNVNLSNINLSRLRLRGINLSGIKLGMPSGNRKPDPIPGLKGIVGLYSGAGLTNEQMSQNPVWKDLSGNGHDLQMKNFAWNDQSGVNITDYPGSIVFDGVDDYGICDSFPILTKEKGYTVMALRQWIRFSEISSNLKCIVSNASLAWNGAFVLEYSNYNPLNNISAYNFGKFNNAPLEDSIFTYQTSKSYNNIDIAYGDGTEGTNELLVGKVYKTRPESTNAAIYSLCIIDHDTTEEERQKVIDYWKKEYPWLFPDQAWTVTGKTNDNEDRATIANITGNGNDLVLSNFGFIEGSGYNEEGGYAGYLVTDGVDDKILSANAFSTEKKWTIVGDWEFLKEGSEKAAGIIVGDSFRAYNYLRGAYVYVYNPRGTIIENVNHIKAVTSDGDVYVDFNSDVIQLPLGDLSAKNSRLQIGCNSNSAFTKIAFKNLAIYNDKVLTKDQCIKAYNYLQTLKAK